MDWSVMLNLLGAVYNSLRLCGGAPVRRFILGMIPEPVSFYTQTFFEGVCMFSIRPFLFVILKLHLPGGSPGHERRSSCESEEVAGAAAGFADVSGQSGAVMVGCGAGVRSDFA